MILWYNLLERNIKAERYTSKEDMQLKIDNAYQKKRITETEKLELESLLNLSKIA